jgi:hypothetical protein
MIIVSSPTPNHKLPVYGSPYRGRECNSPGHSIQTDVQHRGTDAVNAKD